MAACASLLAAAAVRGEPAPRPVAIPISAAPGRAGEAVRTWLAGRLTSLGLEDGVDALIVQREESLPGGGSRVLIQQLWHGLPVVGGDARAIVSGDGRLTSLASGFVRGLNAPLAPVVTPAVASALAARAAQLPAGTQPGTATLSVWRRDDGDRLVWEVGLRRPGGEPVRSEIDAVTGEVLEADAGITHAVGRVYPTDPTGPLQELELFRMEPGTPLHSAAFDIEDQLAPPVVPVVPGDYRLTPDDPGFDQVNLYWHVDHYFNDFLAPLGYAGPPTPLVVRLHADMNPWPALATGNYVTFGLPIPGFTLESSRSHDIVYHELTHTVIYGFGIQPDGPNAEAGALHEGIADYFAAAFTGDPVIGEWLYISFTNKPGMTRIDQPVPPWDYAHYNQVAYNGGAAGTTHGNGMILSSALWDLRRQVGSTCDSLVLESLAYLPSRPVWAQFADALIAADLDHHAGREWLTVGNAMRVRGIRGAVGASISGPAALLPGETGAFGALPCCGGATGRRACRGTRRAVDGERHGAVPGHRGAAQRGAEPRRHLEGEDRGRIAVRAHVVPAVAAAAGGPGSGGNGPERDVRGEGPVQPVREAAGRDGTLDDAGDRRRVVRRPPAGQPARHGPVVAVGHGRTPGGDARRAGRVSDAALGGLRPARPPAPAAPRRLRAARRAGDPLGRQRPRAGHLLRPRHDLDRSVRDTALHRAALTSRCVAVPGAGRRHR